MEIDKTPAKKPEPDKTPVVQKAEISPAEKPNAAKGIDSLSVSMQQWTKQTPRYTKLLGRNEGLGIFGGVAGNFRGFGEHVSVQINASQKPGSWKGAPAPTPGGYACTVTGIPPGWFDLEKTTFVRWWANGPRKMDPPKELCSESEGICWLSGIAADMSNGRRKVHVALEGPGKMASFGGECPIYTVSGMAAVCRFSKNADPAKLQAFRSHPSSVKDGPLRLLDVKDGFYALVLDPRQHPISRATAHAARQGRRMVARRKGCARAISWCTPSGSRSPATCRRSPAIENYAFGKSESEGPEQSDDGNVRHTERPAKA